MSAFSDKVLQRKLICFQEATSQDQARRLQRQLRDLKENYTALQQKETEVNAKKNEYEKKLELGKAKGY